MSNFNDKALRGVADAVSKIMDEELKGNQHKIDANKNGKVDAHDFKLLRGKKDKVDTKQQTRNTFDGMFGGGNPANKLSVMKKEEVKKNEYHIAGKHKFPTKDEHAVTVKHTESGREHVHSGKGKYLSKLIKSRYDINHQFESVELDEAFPTVDDAKKRMDAGKTSTGSVTKTKTGLVHKRDYKDDDSGAEDMQKKSSGYGARQNFKRSSRVNEQLSFTEMLHLYNEHGLEVISKIVPQTVKFGDTEVELIDANIVNGAVGITVAEEVDNETFTKEVEAQKEKNAGRGKKADVAKPSVQAVKQEEVETPSIHVRSMYTKHYAKHGGTIYKAKEASTKAYDAVEKMHGKEMRDKLQAFHRKNMNEETEQIDELSKDTLSMYVKKAHYSGGMADFKHGRISDKRGDSKDKMKLSKISRNRERGINKAVDRLTKKD